MSLAPDLRENGSYSEAVQKLRMQWPSDPFRPSPMRTQVSGIDCLAVLYRFLLASLPRGQWPPVEPIGATNQAILRYFWADFGPRRFPIGQDRDQLRQAALSQIQRTMQVANVDFAALCESPAMMEVLWARPRFCFYGTPWSRPKGDGIWQERPDLHTPTELAAFGRWGWDPQRHPEMQNFVDQMREFVTETQTRDGGIIELRYAINEPLVVQIRLTVGQGVRMSLNDVRQFTVTTVGTGDNNVQASGPAKTYGYVLAAVVQTRNAASGVDHDTIRVFVKNGQECVPINVPEFIGGERWPKSVKDALPEGQTYLLFYQRVTELISDSLVDAARQVGPPGQTTWMDDKLAEDQDWFEYLSADEEEEPTLGPAPAQGGSSSSVPQHDMQPQGQLFSAGPDSFGSSQQVEQRPAGWQGITQETTGAQGRQSQEGRLEGVVGDAPRRSQQARAPLPSPSPPESIPRRRGSRGRSGSRSSRPTGRLSSANNTSQGSRRNDRSHR